MPTPPAVPRVPTPTPLDVKDTSRWDLGWRWRALEGRLERLEWRGRFHTRWERLRRTVSPANVVADAVCGVLIEIILAEEQGRRDGGTA